MHQGQPRPADRLERELRLSRVATFALLFLVFDLCYILCPFWRLPMPPSWQAAALVLTAASGLIWAYLAAAEHRFTWSWPGVLALLVIAAAVVLLNSRALLVGIPWRGDESFHLSRSISLLRGVMGKLLLPLVLTIAMAVAAQFLRARGNGLWPVAVAAALLVGFQAIWIAGYDPFPPMPFAPMGVARYPSLVGWLSAAPWFVLSPWWQPFEPFRGPYVEVIFRLLPLACSVLLAWHASRALRSHSLATRLVLAVAIASMPIVFYYTSILYLEMPALLCMAVVLAGGERALMQTPRQLRQSNLWLALLVIGFVKETTLPFLAVFVTLRLAVRAVKLGRALTGRALMDELSVGFCAAWPLATYLLFRTLWGVPRTVTPELGNLLQIDLWQAAAVSYVEQFGGLLVLALAGVTLLIGRRQWLAASFLVGVFGADLAFHFIDKSWWVGYSRFNLFLVPSVVVAACLAVARLARWRAPVAVALLALTIAANLVWSPIHLDGNKRPGWGSSEMDTAEHYYPYREAIQYINDAHARDRVLFAGMYYHYPVALYLRKDIRHAAVTDGDQFGRFPFSTDDDPAVIGASLNAAAHDGFDVILWQFYGRAVPEVPLPPGYRRERVFENSAHRLVLYACERRESP